MLRLTCVLLSSLVAFGCSDASFDRGNPGSDSPNAPINDPDSEVFDVPHTNGSGSANVEAPPSPEGTGGGGGPAAPVPEPTSLLLVGSGLVGLSLYRRRRKTAADSATDVQ